MYVNKVPNMDVEKSLPIEKEIQDYIDNDDGHPFASLTHRQFQRVSQELLTLSQLFPYVVAAAYGDIVKQALKTKQPITEKQQVTFAAGAYLMADEVGSNHIQRTYGLRGVHKTLEIAHFAHSHLYKKDIETLLGGPIDPSFSDVTTLYIERLQQKLGDFSDVHRAATMIAFEQHADVLLKNLWISIQRLYPTVKKEHFPYFYSHIAENQDSLEQYHVALTRKLIHLVVEQEEQEQFLEYFKDAYTNNKKWARRVVDHD